MLEQQQLVLVPGRFRIRPGRVVVDGQPVGAAAPPCRRCPRAALGPGVQPEHPPASPRQAAMYSRATSRSPGSSSGHRLACAYSPRYSSGTPAALASATSSNSATLNRSSSSRPKSSGHCRQPRYGCGLASSAFSARGRPSSRPPGQVGGQVRRHAVVDHLNDPQLLRARSYRLELRAVPGLGGRHVDHRNGRRHRLFLQHQQGRRQLINAPGITPDDNRGPAPSYFLPPDS